MKIPKTRRTYCPYCRTHTEHEVILQKAVKKRGALKKGQRRFQRKMKGYGSFPRPNPQHGVKHNIKSSKKPDIRYKCKVCGKMHNQSGAKRLKKRVELV